MNTNFNFSIIELPTWADGGYEDSEKVEKAKMNLLTDLVDRVRKLDGVTIPTTTFITDDDEIVMVPGPWTIDKRQLPRAGSNSKFVVRNEFGHARVQQFMVPQFSLNRSGSGMTTAAAVHKEDMLFEAGGHCVLHPAVFKECIEKKWGVPHPLAGHFHPIAGSHIPETTMLFRVPRNEKELDVIWSIVQKSYNWVLSRSDE